MVVPNGNPGKGLMTEKKIKVGPVCSYSLPVVIECEDCPVWEWNASKALPPSVVAVAILIDASVLESAFRLQTGSKG